MPMPSGTLKTNLCCEIHRAGQGTLPPVLGLTILTINGVPFSFRFWVTQQLTPGICSVNEIRNTSMPACDCPGSVHLYTSNLSVLDFGLISS